MMIMIMISHDQESHDHDDHGKNDDDDHGKNDDDDHGKNDDDDDDDDDYDDHDEDEPLQMAQWEWRLGLASAPPWTLFHDTPADSVHPNS